MPSKKDPFRKAMGERLEALRLALGFKKIRAFANEIGVDEDRYTKWEKGRAMIPPQDVNMLRDRYRITADWLYYGDTSGLPRALYDDLRAPKRAA